MNMEQFSAEGDWDPSDERMKESIIREQAHKDWLAEHLGNVSAVLRSCFKQSTAEYIISALKGFKP